MKELKLSPVEEINLRSHNSIQYATAEHFENHEKVMIDKVGICMVKANNIQGLIKLSIVQKYWIYSKEGELIRMPKWCL